MILFLSKQERELVARLRAIEPTTELAAEVVRLKREIGELEIEKSRREEEFARQDRELRHMIGLERKRQEVEIAQAQQAATLTVREENLKAERERFEEQLTFNTKRFETMEKYLKDMLSDILQRLPNVNVSMNR